MAPGDSHRLFNEAAPSPYWQALVVKTSASTRWWFITPLRQGACQPKILIIHTYRTLKFYDLWSEDTYAGSSCTKNSNCEIIKVKHVTHPVPNHFSYVLLSQHLKGKDSTIPSLFLVEIWLLKTKRSMMNIYPKGIVATTSAQIF